MYIYIYVYTLCGCFTILNVTYCFHKNLSYILELYSFVGV